MYVVGCKSISDVDSHIHDLIMMGPSEWSCAGGRKILTVIKLVNTKQQGRGE